MFAQTYAALPCQLKVVCYLFSGMAIGLPLLAIPKKGLVRIGKMPHLSPNWISFWRLPVFWAAIGLYALGHPYKAFCLFVFAIILDRIDGKVAKALQESDDPRYPGETEMGKWFDPLIDKLTMTAPFIIFCATGMLLKLPVTLMVTVELIGTITRKPVIDKWHFKHLQKHVRTGEASGIGKAKFVLQCLCLFGFMTYDQQWVTWPTWILDGGVTAMVPICTLSVASRLNLGKKLNELVDWITGNFKH